MENLLYRGVNKSQDAKDDGKIYPKGASVKVVARHDGRIKYDGTFFYGPCVLNTARAQQIDSGLYDGAGISTSRSERTARHFATSGNTEDGFVYVIDASRLTEEGVVSFEFSNPEHPHEREVTLILRSKECLPPSLIVEKYEISINGERT